MISLEEEYSYFKAKHKYEILQKRIKELVLENADKMNVPVTVNKEELERRINFMIIEIANTGKLDELYEDAWQYYND